MVPSSYDRLLDRDRNFVLVGSAPLIILLFSTTLPYGKALAYGDGCGLIYFNSILQLAFELLHLDTDYRQLDKRYGVQQVPSRCQTLIL